MDEAWKDLPPEVAEHLLLASRAFADSFDKLKSALEHNELV